MARASGVSFAIDSAAVPIATPEGRRAEALRWGEDYQLLFTLPVGVKPPVKAYQIGDAVPSVQAPILLDGQLLGEESGLGYEHR
jgi:thiamine-monophosphate kinase